MSPFNLLFHTKIVVLASGAHGHFFPMNNFLYFFYVCLCIILYMCGVYVCMHAYVSMNKCRLQDNLKCHFSDFIHLVFGDILA